MSNKASNSPHRKICIFVNVDWFVLSHFSDYLSKIVAKNYNVTILTLNTGLCSELKHLGVEVKEVNLHRGYLNIFSEIAAFISIFKAIRQVSPDVLELITIKPVLYGGIIAYLLRINSVIFYMSGLGSTFTSETFFGKFKSNILLKIYRLIMRSSKAKLIVENEDDLELFKTKVGVKPEKIYQVSGVGVDLKKFSPNYKSVRTNLRVAMASRLLYDKGIVEFFLAAKMCKIKFPNIDFCIVGNGDPTNPKNISNKSMAALCKDSNVRALGHLDDMERFLKTIDIFVLPSYREGFPRVIMEASATGVPTVTTDVTGCRSAVLNRITGIIVPVKNPNLLADAILELIESPYFRKKLSINARDYAEEKFDVHKLSLKHMGVWL